VYRYPTCALATRRPLDSSAPAWRIACLSLLAVGACLGGQINPIRADEVRAGSPGAMTTDAASRGAIHNGIKEVDRTAVQDQPTEQLARDLDLAHTEIERLKADAADAQAASQRAIGEMGRALDQFRVRSRQLQNELAAAQRRIAQLNAQAELETAARIDAAQKRERAQSAARDAQEMLSQERQRTASAIEQLKSAQHERDAMNAVWEEMTTVLQKALDGERESKAAMVRDLEAALAENARLGAQLKSVRVEQPSGQRPAAGDFRRLKSASVKAAPRKSAKSARAERVTTIGLPESLLPTVRPFKLLQQ
jgi:hypothetical protein